MIDVYESERGLVLSCFNPYDAMPPDSRQSTLANWLYGAGFDGELSRVDWHEALDEGRTVAAYVWVSGPNSYCFMRDNEETRAYFKESLTPEMQGEG